MKLHRRGESGNVFFTLFGAIALVGVIGVATATLMRGPVGTVMALNLRAKVNSQLEIARKLVALDAVNNQPSGGDCDADGTVEPTPPDLSAGCTMHPVGGGCIPSTVGAAKTDPWGTLVGYCGWDQGSVHAGCNGLLKGENPGNNKTVIAIISAGADRQFQATCGDAPAYVTKGGDDIVEEWTLDEAQTLSGGGLWTLMSGNPNAITTNKNVDISNNSTFASGTTATFQGNADFGAGSKLSLASGALFNLPTQVTLTDAMCSGAAAAANDSVMRVNTTTGRILQMCDPTALPAAHWIDIGGSNAVTKIDDLTDAVSDYSTGGNLFLGNGGGDLIVPGSALDNVAVGVNAGFNITTGKNNLLLGYNAGHIINTGSNNILINPAATDNTAIASTSNLLDIGSLIYGALPAPGGGAVGILTATPGSTLDVNGTFHASGTGNIGGVLTAGSDLAVTGNSVLSGTLDTKGASIFENTIDAQGAIANSLGAVTVGDDIHVTGTAVFDNTMDIQGAATLETTADIKGIVTAETDVNVTGHVQAQGAVGGLSYELGAIGSGVGLLPDTTNLKIKTTGGLIEVLSGGFVGIGNVNPQTELDVAGAIKVGQTASGCGLAIYGAIRYSSSNDKLQICSSDGMWETVGTSGGGGSGSTAAAGVISDIQFNSGGFLGANGSFVFTSAGRLGVGTAAPLARLEVNNGNFLDVGTYTGTFSIPVSGAGSRMFFDPASGSFRAGAIDGSQWDSGNIGIYSAAFGYDSQAAGSTGFAAGNYADAFGFAGVALGAGVTARGANSMALGNQVDANGANSLAIGLSPIATANYPVVSGTGSFGIFMQDQHNNVLAANNTMGLFGGRMVIDPNSQATLLAPNANTDLDVNGNIGAVNYCDVSGSPCFTAAEVAGGATGAPGSDRDIIFNSGGKLGAFPTFVFTSAGRMGIGTLTPAALLHVKSASGASTIDIDTANAGDWSILQFSRAGVNKWSLYSDDNDKFNLRIGGSDKVTVLNNGNVGIGTAAPASKLETIFSGFYGNNKSGGNGLQTSTGHTTSDYTLYMGADAATHLSYIQSVNWGVTTAPLVFNARGGNVGIGTLTPFTKLDVAGTVKVADGGETCNTVNFAGGIRYTSAKLLQYCDGTKWETLASSGSGGVTAAGVQGNVQFNSGGVLGANPLFTFTSGGALGIGTATPRSTAKLHLMSPNTVTSTAFIMDTPAITEQATMSFFSAGGQRWQWGKNTDDSFFLWDQTALRNDWVIASGGDMGLMPGGGKVGVGTLNPGELLFVSGGNVVSTGKFGAGPAIAESGAGTRMMWYPRKAAFRAGYVSGVNWDDANIGSYSTGLGYNTQASGSISMAWGEAALALGYDSTAWGTGSVASGNYSTAFGVDAVAGDGVAGSGFGNDSIAIGFAANGAAYPRVTGTGSFGLFMQDQHNKVFAADHTMALLGGQFIIDPNSQATLLAPPRAGLGLTVNGDVGATQYCDALGNNCFVPGSGASIAAAGSPTDVQFNSGGKLWGNNNLVFTSAGRLGIGTAAPSSPLQITSTSNPQIKFGYDAAHFTSLYTDSSGNAMISPTGGYLNIGSAGNGKAITLWQGSNGTPTDAAGIRADWNQLYLSNSYGKVEIEDATSETNALAIQESGTPWNSLDWWYDGTSGTGTGMWMGFASPGASGNMNMRLGDTAGATQFRVLNSSSVTKFVVNSAGSVGVNTATPGEMLFVSGGNIAATGKFGSGPALAEAGVGTRMIWYPKKAAFRAGQIDDSTEWDDVNVGTHSVAFGYNTRASGDGAAAFGNWTSANSDDGFAVGDGAGVSGGVASVSMGSHVNVSGNRAMAFGLTTTSVTPYPNVSGTGSFGIFMQDQHNKTLAANNTMALLGGQFIIDPNSAATLLASPRAGLGLTVNGDVGATQYCDAAGNNCFVPGSGASISAAGANTDVQFNSGGKLWGNNNLVFTSAGRLGIGTAAPGAKLEINSHTTADTAAQLMVNTPSGQHGLVVQAAVAANGTFLTQWQNSAGNPIASMDDYGDFVAGSGAVRMAFDNNLSHYAITGNSDLYITSGINGTTAYNIFLKPSSTGKVGVGNLAPATMLDVTGTVRVADGGETCAAGVKGGIRYTSTNILQYCDSTSWKTLASTSGGIAWNNITSPTGNLSLTMGADTSLFTYGAATGAGDLFKLQDTAGNTGTGYMLNVATAASSTENPFHVGAAGIDAITVNKYGEVGIGTNSPIAGLDVDTAMFASTGAAYGVRLSQPLGAGANNDALYGLYINTVYNDNAKTGVTHTDIGFDGTASRTIAVGTNAAAVAGSGLTINAGNSGAGTDKAGGNLTLSGGASTGVGGSNIVFKTSVGYSTGTTANAPATVWTMDQFGNLVRGGGNDVKIAFDSSVGQYAYSNAGDTYITSGYNGGAHNILLMPSSTGKVGVGTLTPNANTLLDVNGNVGAVQYCDFNGNNCFVPGSGSSVAAAGANTDVQFNSGGKLWGNGNLTFTSAGLLKSVNYDTTAATGYYRINGKTVLALPDADFQSIAVGISALANQAATGLNNTALGTGAGQNISTGPQNTAVGQAAMAGVSGTPLTGGYNTAVGNAALYVLQGAAAYNTAVGRGALEYDSTGSHNTATGYAAMLGASGNKLTGSNNTAVGDSALYSIQGAGNDNTALGFQAGYSISTATGNVAIGYNSLYLDDTGTSNIAIGSAALYANVSGGSNIAIGYNALTSATVSTNTAIGYQALLSDTTGTNTAVGYSAGAYISTGAQNTAIGISAMQGITGTTLTGNANTAVGEQALFVAQGAATSNTAVGMATLQSNTTGSYNSALGQGALGNNSTGSSNTAAGHAAIAGNAGVKLTGGNNAAFGESALQVAQGAANQNTALGAKAGSSITTGADNTLIGYTAGSLVTGASNIMVGEGGNITTGASNILIGNSLTGTTATASNQLDIGDLINGNLNTKTVGINQAAPANGLTLDVNGNVGAVQYCDTNGANCFVPGSGSSVAAAGANTDIQFNSGGKLWGTNSLVFTSGGHVGIGTASPGQPLSVAGTILADAAEANTGTLANGLLFGKTGTGEGIGSKRDAGGNQWGLDFYTDSITRMSIANTGNVGIGTTTPADTLEIVRSASSAMGPQLRLTNSAGNGGAQVAINLSTYPHTIPEGQILATDSFDFSANIDFMTKPPGNANNPLTSRLHISSGGYVGIGTTAPANQLTVKIASAGDGMTIDGSTTGTVSPQFSLSADGAQRSAYGLALGPAHYSGIAAAGDSVLRALGGTGNLILTNQESGNIIFATGTTVTNDTAKATLLANGNFGIGTPAPSGRLEVSSSSAGVTVGDLLVDTTGKVVNIGRLSSTASDNTILNVRNRSGTSVIYSDTGNGTVGIGNNSPATKLDVTGTVRVADGGETCAAGVKGGIRYTSANILQYCNSTQWKTLSASGSVAAAGVTGNVQYNSGGVLAASSTFTFTSAGRLGIGTATPIAKLDVTGTVNTFDWESATSGSITGAGIGQMMQASSNSSAQFVNLDAYSSVNNNVNYTNSIYGIQEQFEHKGTGTISDATGGLYQVNNISTGIITTGIAGSFSTLNQSSGSITNAFGVDINGVHGATAGYGLYVASVSGATNNYDIYASDSGATNYFAGNIGIGTTTPAAILDVKGTSASYGILVRSGSSSDFTNLGANANYAYLGYNNVIGTNGIVVLGTGNVGINNTAPATKLDVTGTVRVADGGETCAAGVKGGIRYTSTNVLQYCDSTSWKTLANSAGGVAWNTITNPTGNQALTMAGYTSTWTYGATTGAGVDMFKIADGAANTGTGYLMNITTGATSAASPLHLRAKSAGNDLVFTSGGRLGIGTTNPASTLSVYGGQIYFANTGAVGFGQLYNDGWVHLEADNTSGQTMGFSAPNGFNFRPTYNGTTVTYLSTANGNSYINAFGGNVGINTTAPGELLFVSGGNVASTGTFGASPAIAESGAGTRMMWYPRKAAFRAGGVTGTQWDDGSIGNYSTALGSSTTASGWWSSALGNSTTASGNYSLALGYWTTAAGNNSLAFGLSSISTANASQVSGTGSFGIFMQDQHSKTLAANNTMALLGGQFIIDPNSQSTLLAPPRAGLGLTVNGDIGATQYCDAAGNNCFVPGSGASVAAAGSNTDVQFNSGGKLWGNNNLVFTSAGRLGIGTASPTTALEVYKSTDPFASVQDGHGSLNLMIPSLAGNGVSFSAQYDSVIFGYGGVILDNKSAGPIKFGTNDTQRMIIDANGNVGIGTTTPAAWLHINPTQTATTDTTSFKSGLVYNGGSAMTNWYGAYVAAPTGSGTITNKYALVTEAGAGNVGIGTLTPTNNLQVGTQTGTSTATPVTLSLGGTYSSVAGANPKLKLYDAGGVIGFGVSNNSLDVILPSGSGFNWYVNGGNVMGLTNAGNLGINNTSPATKLDVTGTVRVADGGETCAAGVKGGIRYTSTNVLQYCDSTSWKTLANSAGGVAWNTITNPTGNQALTMAGYTSTWTYGATTGAGVDMFKIADAAANTGTGYLMNITTGATSAASPLHLRAKVAGAGDLVFTSAGRLGIGTTTPGVALDIEGSSGGLIRLGTTGNNHWDIAGQYYNTNADLVFYMQGTEKLRINANGELCLGYATTNCTGSNSLIASGSVGINTATPGEMLFVSGGNVVSTGTLGAGPAIAESGAGTRMMWYPKKAAFRAGFANFNEWDDANIGNYSMAMGWATTASGGWSTAFGDTTTASNNLSTAFGYMTTASGNTATAFGFHTTASAQTSTAFGQYAVASGPYSLAIGLNSDATANYGEVSGAGSFGIFMQSQHNKVVASSNTMALLGGQFIIDPNATATLLAPPRAGLGLTVNGDIGATQYCDAAGNNCFVPGSGASVAAAGSNTDVQFNSGGKLWGNNTLVFTSAGRLGIGTAAPFYQLTISNGAANPGVSFFTQAPGLSSGNSVAIGLGISSTIGNAGYLVWNDAATSYLSLETYGGANPIQIKSSQLWLNPGGGNVGIGTTAPGAYLQINPTQTATTDTTMLKSGLVYNGGSAMTNWYGAYVAAPTGTGTITNKYALVTEAGAGNVGIGTLSPVANLQVGQVGQNAHAFFINGLTTNPTVGTIETAVEHSSGIAYSAPVNILMDGNDTMGGVHVVQVSSNATSNSFYSMIGERRADSGSYYDTAAPVVQGMYIPGIGFAGMGANASGIGPGSAMTLSASLQALVDGAVSANVVPMALVFNTSATSAAGLSERMRIASNGNVGIGNAAPATKLDVTGTVRVADGGEACSGTVKGGIRYTSTNVLQYCNSTSWKTLSSSGSVAAAGVTGNVQYNSGGALGASANFAWNNTTSTLTAGNYDTGAVTGTYKINGKTVLTYPFAGADATGFAVGPDSLTSQTTGSLGNVAVGVNAGQYISTAGYNTAVGYLALQGVTGARMTGAVSYNNTAVGSQALQVAQDGAAMDTAVGANALVSLTTGDRNTALGNGTLANVTTGGYNTAVGNGAMIGNSVILTGSYNTAVGDHALENIQGAGSNNTVMGRLAGDAVTTATDNILLGYTAGNLITGNSNIVVGEGGNITSGSSNILIGNNLSGTTAGSSSQLDIGDLIYGVLGGGKVGIGTISPATKLDVPGTVRVADGGETCAAGIKGGIRYTSTNVLQYCNSTAWKTLSASGSVAAAGVTGNVQYNSGGVLAASSTFTFTSAGRLGIGTAAPKARLDVAGSIDLTGVNGLWQDATNANVAIGPTTFPTTVSQAGGGTNGQSNVAIGNQALNAGGVGFDLIAIGDQAMKGGGSASDQIAIGQKAMYSAQSGTNSNIAIGNLTLYSNTLGTSNIMIGEAGTGYYINGSGNIAIGTNAMNANGNGNMEYNVGIGTRSLWHIGAGAAYNLALGSAVGATTLVSGSNNILIGSDSSTDTPLATTSNFLNIGNAIYGVNLMNATNTTGIGHIGINNTGPATALDVTGTVRVADGGEACGAGVKGGIRYTSTNVLQYCNSTAWKTLSASGSVAAAGVTGNVQYNSGGSLAASSTFTYTSAGRLGVGTASPGTPLQVGGTLTTTDFTGSALLPTGAQIFDTPTSTASATSQSSLFILSQPQPASNSSTNFQGIQEDVSVPSSVSSTISGVYGQQVLARQNGTGNVGTIVGVLATANNASTSATVTNAYGIDGIAKNASTGAITTAYGGQFFSIDKTTGAIGTAYGTQNVIQNQGAGAITTAYGSFNEVNNLAAGAVTTAYGVYSDITNPGGTVTTGYGLYTGTIAATNKWSVYANDATAPSYFAGKVGIGTAAPGTALAVQTSTLYDGITLSNGTNNVAQLTGNSGANDNGTLALMTGGTMSVLIRSSGAGYINNYDSFGFGTATPYTKLDVAGTVKVGDGGETCGVNYAGGIRYTSANVLQYCNKTAWKTLSASGAAAAAGITGNVQYNSGGSLAASSTFTYTSAGRLGIGTAAPATPLQVGGALTTTDFTGSALLPTGAQIFDTPTTTASVTQQSSLFILSQPQPASNSSATFQGILEDTSVPSSVSSTISGLYGQQVQTTQNGTGNVGSILGILAVANNASTSATVTNGYGIEGVIKNISTGAITTAYGGQFAATNKTTGAIGTAYGIQNLVRNQGAGAITTAYGSFNEVNNLAAGTFTTAYGVYSDILNPGGTVTTGYGLYTGTIAATNKWSVYANDATAPSYFAGNVGIGTASPSAALTVAGDITYSGISTATSDIRMKKDIAPLATDVLARLADVKTYSFRYKNDPTGRLQYGVIAQEVEKQFPNLVVTAADAMKTKSVNYLGFIAPLIEANKKMKAENDDLRRQVAALKAEHDETKQALNDIQDQIKGMKAYTGYGVDKAGFDGWIIVAMTGILGLSGGLFFIGTSLRRRKPKAQEGGAE